MARGNDGNLLQHAVEAEIASKLFALNGERGLYVVLTHGMRPFEEFDEERSGAFSLLDNAIECSCDRHELADKCPRVLLAYRKTGAHRNHYPNSAEVIATLVPRDAFHGVITEKQPDNYDELKKRWNERPLRVLPGNWRDRLGSDFAPPPELKMPWLITLDPYRFEPKKKRPQGCDDGYVYQDDLADLHGDLLRPYVSAFPDGALTVFCYSMSAKVVQTFESSVVSHLISDLHQLYRMKISTKSGGVHGSAKYHVAYAIAPSYDLLRTAQHACANLGLTAEQPTK